MATKSPFPPKSMLKNSQNMSTLTEICRMGSKQTSKIVRIIFNIDSGGRGDLKEVRVILTNIFGEDCLGSFCIVKSDVFVGLPFAKVILWIGSLGNTVFR